jgi:serine/threonine protein kinase
MQLPQRCFAIKCLRSGDMEDFKKEVEMLKKFSNDSHPHLISLLATYEQLDIFHLVFHWADADLYNFWTKAKPNPTFEFDTVIWLAEQCEGIADGLSKIHCYETTSSKIDGGQLFGRHGDIKPENILWFRDSNKPEDKGVLKICDFGLAEFNTRSSRSNKPRYKVANSPTYRPPECDIKGGVISRSYDIWTLGCLYLDFITWLLGGEYLFRKFSRERKGYVPNAPYVQEDTFFELVQETNNGATHGVVKPAVTKVSYHDVCMLELAI